MEGTKGARRSTGLWIAFYGPDGAGKSSVIERVVGDLAGYFHVSHRYHLRPNWLGRTTLAPVTNPHGVAPRGRCLSALKLLFLLVDYVLGHWLLVRRKLANGHLVVFDRYFEDHLVDPLRYRLPSSAGTFAEALAKWIPAPQLRFVLDVPGPGLQRRKPEVAPAESERQRRDYAQRLGRHPNTIVIDADRPITDVSSEVVRHILAFLFPEHLTTSEGTPC